MEGPALSPEAEKVLTALYRANEKSRGAFATFDEQHKASLKTMGELRGAIRRLRARGFAETPLLSGDAGTVRARITDEGITHWEIELKY